MPKWHALVRASFWDARKIYFSFMEASNFSYYPFIHIIESHKVDFKHSRSIKGYLSRPKRGLPCFGLSLDFVFLGGVIGDQLPMLITFYLNEIETSCLAHFFQLFKLFQISIFAVTHNL
jgi:hypothetical protein